MRLGLLTIGGVAAGVALAAMLAPAAAAATDFGCSGGIIWCGRVDDPHTNENCTHFQLDPNTGHLVCTEWSGTDTYRHGP